MTTLTVNDLRFELRRSDRRRALEITVDRGGALILSAPPDVPDARLRDFVQRTGVTKKEHLIQMSLLENCVREDLNVRAPRAMAVLQPLKVVLLNYPEGQTEMLRGANHPDRPELGGIYDVRSGAEGDASTGVPFGEL